MSSLICHVDISEINISAAAGFIRWRSAVWVLLFSLKLLSETCHISGYLYNERFSESNEKNVWAFKICVGPLLFIKTPLKTTQLLFKNFPWVLSLFASLIFFFIKARILLWFLKCFENFYLSKNVLINKLFHWSMCFFIVLPR